MVIEEMPISSVIWVDVDTLSANDYNPNVVFKKEMNLLKFSILKNGWIQPILTTSEGVIIDGFHRATLAKVDKQVRGMTGGKVPVVQMEMSEPERVMLTVRINRAKGTHIAVRMADLVKQLVNDYGCSIEQVCSGIGATKDEVELLLCENVFKAKKIDKSSDYSKAWYPVVE